MMRIFTLTLSLLLIVLQFQLWVGEGSLAQHWQLGDKISEQKYQNSGIQARNDALAAEVIALQQGANHEGLEAVEGLARHELGMVRKGETYFFMPD